MHAEGFLERGLVDDVRAARQDRCALREGETCEPEEQMGPDLLWDHASAFDHTVQFEKLLVPADDVGLHRLAPSAPTRLGVQLQVRQCCLLTRSPDKQTMYFMSC